MQQNFIDKVIVRNHELDTTHMDGEVVMMNIEKGKYYCFNSVGSRIWELIESPLEVTNLVERLLGEFSIDRDKCENEVEGFLKRIYDEGLINIV